MKQSQMKHFKCLACGSDRCRPYYQGCRDYYLGLGQPVDYVACAGCGLVQQWPVPEDVSPFYLDYPVHVRRTVVQRFARRVLQRQVYFRPSPAMAAGTLLDFGCGDGVYLREMEGRFARRVGYEPGAAHAARLAESTGLPIYHDVAALSAEWKGRVDVVVAHYVMEHVTDLHAAMRCFADVLVPGGLLHIAVPHVRSWEARLFKRAWHGLDAPRHISFPDETVFRRLGSEHGFDPPACSPAIFPNTLAASICTALTGGYHGGLFNLLILPSWCVAALAPTGTMVYQMTKRKS